jgi:hypothetical protein
MLGPALTVAAVAAFAAVLGASQGGAHTFCVTAIGRGPARSAPSCSTWMITRGDPLPFTIAGRGAGALLPGGPDVPLDLVFSNPNPIAITVTGVTVTVAGTWAAGCGAANVVVAAQLGAQPAVPAGTTASLSGLGVPSSAWPRLHVPDEGDQNACRGATVQLAYTGTARG